MQKIIYKVIPTLIFVLLAVVGNARAYAIDDEDNPGRYDFIYEDCKYAIIDEINVKFVNTLSRDINGRELNIPPVVYYEEKPYTVTAIGNTALRFCNLTTLRVPDTVVTIGYEFCSFNDSLETIYIGKSVEAIGDNSFWDCHNLTNFICYAEEPPKLGYACFLDQNFENYYTVPYLYVPEESVIKYKRTDWNGSFQHILPLSYFDGDSGVEGLPNEPESPVTTFEDYFEVYNLSGMLIKNGCNSDELQTLPKGIEVLPCCRPSWR